MTHTTIITAPSSNTLNSKMEKMISEGWKPIGQHTAIVVHSQNRYRGTQHMDTLHECEYSITMIKETADDTISIGIYSYDDEVTGMKIYDEEEMRNEFETKLAELIN